jgi:hypothetical protein
MKRDATEWVSSLFRAVHEVIGEGVSLLTREQLVDWAYRQAGLENPDVTREVAERAVDRLLNRDGKDDA